MKSGAHKILKGGREDTRDQRQEASRKAEKQKSRKRIKEKG